MWGRGAGRPADTNAWVSTTGIARSMLPKCALVNGIRTIIRLSQGQHRMLLTALASRTARSTRGSFGDSAVASHETVDLFRYKSLERCLTLALSRWSALCLLLLRTSRTGFRLNHIFQKFGFARPAGQKSNKSNASDVHGPCSLGSFSLLAAWNDPPVRVWWVVNVVGSDIDLRKGESRDLFPVSLLIVEDDLNPDSSIISSKINCVDVEGKNSSFEFEESLGPAASLYKNQYHKLG